jgi:DNA-binding transcriptional regulator YhcF (GntR family)
MKKKEWVYRELLYRHLERKERFFSQLSIGRACGVSQGMVNKALEPLERMNAIEKKSQGFAVVNAKKALLYWASIRNLERDIVFRTRAEKPVAEIEKEMPKVMFTAYSAYKFRSGTAPSDYSEVVVYGDGETVRERFGSHSGVPNIIVLKPDPHLARFEAAPLVQVFADLWNLDKWYAEDFIRPLERRLGI